MLKPSNKYLGFDDRKLMWIGIPLISIAMPFVFFNVDFNYYLSIAHQEFFESICYTSAYWLSVRYFIITLRRRYGALEDLWKRLKVLLLFVLPLGPIVSIVITGLVRTIYYFLDLKDVFEPTLIQSLGATYFLIFSVTTLYEAIYFFHKYKEAILEKEQIQQAHIQGQLDNLRNQINPHFLFNSLNTLMNLIPTDSDRAMNYLSKLSKFYRYTVSTGEETLVRLETELENVKIYVDLLKERFHNAIEIELPKELPSNAKILPLCLQLLIENAVKHNIVSNKNPLKIRILIHEDAKYIEVENNVQRKIQEVKSTGMGLKNIKTRISFFTEAPLQVEDKDVLFKVAVPLIYPNE